MGEVQANRHGGGSASSRYAISYWRSYWRSLLFGCLGLLLLLLAITIGQGGEAQTGYTTHFLVTSFDLPGLGGKTYFYSDLDQEINISLLVMNRGPTNQTVQIEGEAPEGFRLESASPTRFLLEIGNATDEGNGLEQGYAVVSKWRLGLVNGSQPEIHTDHEVNFTVRTIELDGTEIMNVGSRNLTRTIRYEPMDPTHDISIWDEQVKVMPRLFYYHDMRGDCFLSFEHRGNIDINLSLELLVEGQSSELFEYELSQVTVSPMDLFNTERIKIRTPYNTQEGNYSAAWKLKVIDVGGRPYNDTRIEHRLNFTLEVIHGGSPMVEFETRWGSGMRPKQEEWFTIPVRITNQGNIPDNFTIRVNNDTLEPFGFRFREPVRYVHLGVYESKLLNFRVYAPARSDQGNSYDLYFNTESNASGYNHTSRFWLFIDFRNPEPVDHVREFIRAHSALLALGLLGVVVVVVVLVFGENRSR